MEGKQSLYQRVLARPGAQLREEPDVAVAPLREVLPFSVFYVYGRRSLDGLDWLRVGKDSHGGVVGWILAKQLLEWNQALTVAFREPVGQDRVMLFRDRNSLKQLIEKGDYDAYERLYQEAESGQVGPGSPVVAIQPKAHIDIKKDFYLLPIQQYEDTYLGAQRALMLRVASVPMPKAKPKPEPQSKPRTAPQTQPVSPAPQKAYRAGIVFVIDSTFSMGPYIDRTREAVRKISASIAEAGLVDRVNFGLAAFRDNLEVVPELGYLAKTYVSLEEGRDAEGFLKRVDSLRAAGVSSKDFIEDAYAGVKEALEEMEWDAFHARYIVLITDAGARTPHDPLGSTGMDADAMRQLVRDKEAAVSVLHLLSPSTMARHDAAAGQYRRLSYYPGIGSFYYGVKTADVDEFGRVLDALAAQITEQVREATAGVPPQPVVAEAPPTPMPEPVPETPEPAGDELAELQEKVAKLGYALRMRYLQNRQDEVVPDVFNAWLVDRDFRDPRRPALDVRVLLTRDQLSDLQYVLKQVLQTAEEGLLSPRNFLNDLKSLAASLSRDPEKLAASTRTTGGGGGNLADLGYMREYIQDLPYTGEVMNLSLEDWEHWSAKRQLEFIQRLESKINYYQALHDHTDLWVSLDGGPVTGDSVYPIALELLP